MTDTRDRSETVVVTDNGGNGLAMALLAILVVVALAVGAWFVFAGGDSDGSVLPDEVNINVDENVGGGGNNG